MSEECFLRPKRFLPIIDFIRSIPKRDLLDLLLNETMLKIFRDYRLISNGFRMIYERFAFAGFTSENYFLFFFFRLIIICKIFWRFRFFLILVFFVVKIYLFQLKNFFIVIILEYYCYKINKEIDIVIHEIESLNYCNAKKFMKNKIYFICSN